MPADPLPEIGEGEATGLTAALYDDIRAVIGVPIVNLVFRHMATVPGCLEWTWSTLRPLYTSGAIPEAAEALTESVLPGRAADLTGPIAAQGLGDEDVAAIERVLDSYGRANPMNAVGLQVVDCLLAEPGSGGAPIRLLGQAELTKPQGLIPLLPMADPQTAPAQTRDALKRLARQIHRGDTGVIPSLYRHFGAWPTFLETLEDALAPVLSDGIDEAAQKMLADSRSTAEALAADMNVLPTDDPDSISALNRLIAQFPLNICRMTVLATLLSRGLRREP